MARQSIAIGLILGLVACSAHPLAAQPAGNEPWILDGAANVLQEIVAVPVPQLPQTMLAGAHGVAVFPGVLKVGFIAGVRHGRGVVLVRDPMGNWGLPTFVTITGGSVGWQAGVQSTDLVLVFKTPQSVAGLLRGKFTLGADAAAAAGPVGRRAEVATDAQLRAEIYSWSRSRGLFAGVSLDGAVLALDGPGNAAFYGVGPVDPARVPPGAARMITLVTRLTNPVPGGVPATAANGQPMIPVAPATGAGVVAGMPAGAAFDPMAEAARAADLVRGEAARTGAALQALLPPEWRDYLALPPELFQGARPPELASLQATLQRFEAVARDPQYQALTARPEFRATYDLLARYTQLLSALPAGATGATAPAGTSTAPAPAGATGAASAPAAQRGAAASAGGPAAG